jgi:serine/threonine protein kinase
VRARTQPCRGRRTRARAAARRTPAPRQGGTRAAANFECVAHPTPRPAPAPHPRPITRSGSPFAAESHLDVYSNVLHTKPKFSASFPPQVADLVGKLLEHDVGKRLGMLKNGVDDIKAHAFFEGYDWQEAPSMRNPRHAAPSPVVACGEHEWLRLDLAPEARATRKTPISREQDKLFAGF